MVKKLPRLIFIPVCIAVFFLAGAPLSSEVSTTVELEVYNTFTMLDKTEAGFSATGLGTLTFSAKAAKNVKAELSLQGTISDSPALLIPRAYIKTRFPGFRITVGKAPVSWGSGFAFNAGDVVFRHFLPAEALSEETLRDTAVLGTSAYVPLGLFSFAEVLLIPPALDIPALISDPEYTAPPISDTRLGGRLYLEAGSFNIEPGYLYNGPEDKHYPYLSLQGHLLADWNIAASVGIETGTDDSEAVYQTFLMSPGGSYTAPFDNGGTLTVRLEALLYPAGEWEEIETAVTDMDNTVSGASASSPRYGLYLYPEINWGISETVAVFVRSIFSVIDLSALTLFGGSWNIFTGFDLTGFISIEGGDDSDTYAYGRPAWLSITAGGKYIF